MLFAVGLVLFFGGAAGFMYSMDEAMLTPYDQEEMGWAWGFFTILFAIICLVGLGLIFIG